LNSVVVKKGKIPEGRLYPVITKDISPTAGGWKSNVFICHNEDELREAPRKITSPEIQIQPFIKKKNEYAIEGFSINHGKEVFFGTALICKYFIQGYYSPYHDATMFEDVDMKNKLCALFKEIGYEGLFEVEFLIDQDRIYYFLEVNMRASCFNYSSTIYKVLMLLNGIKDG